MWYLVILFFTLLGFPFPPTPAQFAKSDKIAPLFLQAEYGTFENYAFVVDDKIVESDELIKYPEAKLHNIYPLNIEVEGQGYAGAVYFYTPNQDRPIVPYVDDPAWFINGTQVSSFDIRSTRPELYRKIKKSIQDTVIAGKLYKGSIHVEMDGDFFASSVALSDVLDNSDLPPDRIIVHWFSPKSYTAVEPDIGMVIRDSYPIFHLDQFTLDNVSIDRIILSDGEWYVVRVIDDRYKRMDFSSKWNSSAKARAIFNAPLSVDTACPCYAADFVNTAGRSTFHRTELNPEPYKGETAYLQKLSLLMGLPSEKPEISTTTDSVTVQFVVIWNGILTGLQSIDSNRQDCERILHAIRRHSCVWSIGMFSGRPVMTRRKMTIFYSKDQSGKMVSLDDLEYRYDK